ncbi:MAG: hypothetical protein NPIRA04_05250 [Nitrospirales bacterium]|nr:MAG: hypothetical protein NPIRA04_05250 [Nitrospirales bacterium]
MNSNTHLGTLFRSYLAEEGILREEEQLAIKEMFAQPRPPMWFLVSGSREFPDESLVRRTIREAIQPTDTLLHGGARGVDTWCAEEAQSRRATVLRRPAQWETYGRSAGMRRNTDMVNELVEQADPYHVFLFWDGESRGTAHMISMVHDRQLPHTLILPE